MNEKMHSAATQAKPQNSKATKQEDSKENQPPQPYFDSLDEFVNGFLVHIYDRALTPTTRAWCAKWWLHAEATFRLDSLWKSWEMMRLEKPATGMAEWLIMFADPMMREVMDPQGPFKGCSPDAHQPRRPFPNGLPTVPRPKTN